jgi:cell division protein FtsL
MASRAATAPARVPTRRRPPARRPARRVSGGRPRKAPLRRAARPKVAALLDTLLHGRGWIALVGVLLVGIVFFNVDLLEINRNIASTTQRSARVKEQNARLRLEVARLANTERIQRTAADRGLVLPAPGDVRYLRARPSVDGRRAAAAARAPSPQPSAPSPQQAPVTQTQPQPQQAPPPVTAPTPAPTAGIPPR